VNELNEFLTGALSALCVIAALHFLRFHRHTRDGLFLLFGAAFVVMAAHWAALAMLPAAHESRPWLYALRFFAFLLLLAGIAHKNRQTSR
jgi:uncharacterized protein DUF5985